MTQIYRVANNCFAHGEQTVFGQLLAQSMTKLIFLRLKSGCNDKEYPLTKGGQGNLSLERQNMVYPVIFG